MRRFGNPWLAIAATVATALVASSARADIFLYNKDGWGFYTRGQVAGFYQLAVGDSDPQAAAGHQAESGGLFNTLSVAGPTPMDPSQNAHVTLSRVRSGVIGSQIGFGTRRDISENVHVDSLMAISLQDISNGRNVGSSEGVDFREAWANLVTPYGAVRFGRMMSIFGSASYDVELLAYRYAIGNPCVADVTSIACGSVGAGVLFPGYNGEIRYATPRVVGLQLQLSMGDPISGQSNSFTMTPVPRFDGQIDYDNQFNETTRLRVIGQGVWQELERVNAGAIQTRTVWGAMGSAILEWNGLSLGGGGWEGAGIGTTRFLEIYTGANDSVSFDGSGEMRLFRGFYGNLAYDYHGTRLAAGTGVTYVRPTSVDLDPMQATVDILDHAAEWHVVFTQKVDALAFTAEYARWTTRWHSAQHETMNFTSVGANFNW